MAVKLNPFYGTLDLVLSDSKVQEIGDARYLKLDQTTEQSVINGAPTFDGSASGVAIIITAGQKLIFDGV